MSEMIRKYADASIKQVSEGVFEFVGSTEALDRDGEVILASGWDLKNFRKNPVVLYGHQYSSLPIGKAKAVIEDKQLKFKDVKFADAETYEFADTVKRLVEAGYLNTVSVGFIPKEWKDGGEENGPRRTFTKQELLEVSVVPVPSNPEALIGARDAGVITTKEFEAITKPETTTVSSSTTDNINGITWVVADTALPQKADTSQAEISDDISYLKELIAEDKLSDSNKAQCWELVEELLRVAGADIPDDILTQAGAIAESKAAAYMAMKAAVDSAIDKPVSTEIKPKARRMSVDDVMRMAEDSAQAARDYELGIVH